MGTEKKGRKTQKNMENQGIHGKTQGNRGKHWRIRGKHRETGKNIENTKNRENLEKT